MKRLLGISLGLLVLVGVIVVGWEILEETGIKNSPDNELSDAQIQDKYDISDIRRGWSKQEVWDFMSRSLKHPSGTRNNGPNTVVIYEFVGRQPNSSRKIEFKFTPDEILYDVDFIPERIMMKP